MIAIGIDIGLTGAITAIDERLGVQIHDLPVVPDGDKGKRLDGRALILLLRQLVPQGVAPVVVFEDIRPRPNPTRGTSIITEGALMRSRGIVEAALDIAGLRPTAVQPQAWKRFFGLIKKDKSDALDVARRLYPSAAGYLKRQKDHNRAESLLIAHYGLRKETQ